MSGGKHTFDIIEEIRKIKQCMCCFGLECSESFDIPEKFEEVITMIEELPDVPDFGVGTEGQVLTTNSLGGTYWNDPKYVQLFVEEDWVGSKLTIPASTHLRGLHPVVQVFKGGAPNYYELHPDILYIEVVTTGDVVLTILSGPTSFVGKIIIM